MNKLQFWAANYQLISRFIYFERMHATSYYGTDLLLEDRRAN